jgi:hypothetical protein
MALSICCTVLGSPVTRAQTKLVASKSAIVQPAGPRGGDGGSNYFNIEGKKNDKHASFGVLSFAAPKLDAASPPIDGFELRLVQSLARFAKDGKLKFYLVASNRDPSDLKFDPKHADGLGDQIKNPHLLGVADFKMVETGRADRFAFALNDGDRTLLQTVIKDGAEIRIVVVPDDDEVAATYFGVGQEEIDRRPRLLLK